MPDKQAIGCHTKVAVSLQTREGFPLRCDRRHEHSHTAALIARSVGPAVWRFGIVGQARREADRPARRRRLAALMAKTHS